MANRNNGLPEDLFKETQFSQQNQNTPHPRYHDQLRSPGYNMGYSYARTTSPSEALEPSRRSNAPRNIKKRKKLHPFFSIINTAITIFLIVTVLTASVFYYAKYQFYKDGPLTYPTVVVIPKGMGVNMIATKLENEGVISSKHIFIASYLYFKRTEPKRLKSGLRFGEYEIPKAASMSRVLEKLTTGKPILYQLTLPEGLTSQQIVEKINVHPNLSGQVVAVPPEGSLLPDTYKFSRDTNRQDLVRRLQAEQQKFVTRLWGKRATGLPVKTIDEALILASIVEKETGRGDERARVAGVFINRLKRGMRLQSDPTIIYGLVGGQGSLGRPILRSEIRQKTPYNTYQIPALPPTPIANPGRAAIEAVLNPAVTKDLYFVADGTGGHAFAQTLKGHRANVAKWRVIEKEIRARQKAEKATSPLSLDQPVSNIPLPLRKPK
ncbi:MAG: endolytic transglycosylase MltG [Pseudomonadota bacterium]